jgi:hypothetical protein
MKSMTSVVFASVLAFASPPSHALIFDFSVTTEDGRGLLGLISASGGLLLLGWGRRRQKIG